MDNGFVVLHRKMTEWGWYKHHITKALFIHLILFANWKDGEFMGHKIKRGDIVRGRLKLAQELGATVQQLRTAINHLKSTNEITTKSTNQFTIYTIVNYEKYQSRELRATSKSTNKSTNEQPTTNQRLTTNKQYNKETIYIPFDFSRNVFIISESYKTHILSNYPYIDLTNYLETFGEWIQNKYTGPPEKNWWPDMQKFFESKRPAPEKPVKRPIFDDKGKLAGWELVNTPNSHEDRF